MYTDLPLHKSLSRQEDAVKLQVINLAAKLCVSNPKQVHVLGVHVLILCTCTMYIIHLHDYMCWHVVRVQYIMLLVDLQ